MTKKVSKTQLIKDELALTPEAKPIEIAEKLKKHGVTAQYVSTVKFNMNKKKTKKKGAGARKMVRKPASIQVDVADLVAAKDFANKIGGVDKAKALLDALVKLS
ncbi:MAG: hypothetical protein RIK87_04615 [Fuerstiella sp.]